MLFTGCEVRIENIVSVWTDPNDKNLFFYIYYSFAWSMWPVMWLFETEIGLFSTKFTLSG